MAFRDPLPVQHQISFCVARALKYPLPTADNVANALRPFVI